MKRLIGWLAKAISYLIFIGPAFVRRGLGNLLAWIWFDVLRIRRQVALSNIAIAFPELNQSQRVKMARRSLQNLGLNFVEYCFLPWLNRSNFESYFVFKNSELLDEVLARGKGVLLLTLHLGHGDLACTGLSLKGYPMIMVSKVFKMKWLNDLWFGMRQRAGTKFVAPRNSSFALLRGLKTGHVTTIPLDQFTGPPIGVRTTFFGHETGTAAGLAVMAERSKAPIVSCFTWRRPDGRHEVEFVHEMALLGASTEEITQNFNNELESFVRLHPEQWMWIHRRWKTFKY